MTILIMLFMVFNTGKLIGEAGVKANLVIGLIALGGSLFLFSGNTPVDGNFVTNVLPASLLGALGMSLAYIPATMAAMSGAKPGEPDLLPVLPTQATKSVLYLDSLRWLRFLAATTASYTGA